MASNSARQDQCHGASIAPIGLDAPLGTVIAVSTSRAFSIRQALDSAWPKQISRLLDP